MRTNIGSGQITLVTAAPVAGAAAVSSNAPALGGQFLLGPTVLVAEAETTEQDGMMGQGGMGGMMKQDQMGEGGRGGGTSGPASLARSPAHGCVQTEQPRRLAESSGGCG